MASTLENNRTQLMVVLAGYRDKMENLMAEDDGLPRRFQRILHLDDYEAPELAQICTKVARERFSLSISPQLETDIAEHLQCAYKNGPCEPNSIGACSQCDQRRKNNGGLAVNMVERAFKQLASRTSLQGVPRNSPLLTQLTSDDFGIKAKDTRPLQSYDPEAAERLTLQAQAKLATALSQQDLKALKKLSPMQLAAIFKGPIEQ